MRSQECRSLVRESCSRPATEPWRLLTSLQALCSASHKTLPRQQPMRDTSSQGQLKITSDTFQQRRDAKILVQEKSQALPIVQTPSPQPSFSHLPRTSSLGHPSTWLTHWQQLPVQKVGQMSTHSIKQEATYLAKAPTLLPVPTPRWPGAAHSECGTSAPGNRQLSVITHEWAFADQLLKKNLEWHFCSNPWLLCRNLTTWIEWLRSRGVKKNGEIRRMD